MKLLFVLIAALISAPAMAKSFNKTFVFRYTSPIPSSYSQGDIEWGGVAICEHPINLNQAPAGVRCAMVGHFKHITISALRILVTRGGSSFSELSEFTYGDTSPYYNLVNIFRYINTQQPFYLNVDLRSGRVFAGVDPKRLMDWQDYGP